MPECAPLCRPGPGLGRGDYLTVGVWLAGSRQEWAKLRCAWRGGLQRERGALRVRHLFALRFEQRLSRFPVWGWRGFKTLFLFQVLRTLCLRAFRWLHDETLFEGMLGLRACCRCIEVQRRCARAKL